jgi:large subunit ribosomal protein L4e
MKINVYTLTGKEKGEVALARPFSRPVRTDLIKRAVLAERSEKRQAYGSNPIAGMRTSAHYHGKRHYRYTMMNREMARMKRIHGRVGFLAMTARIVPQATKGRKAHPPKAVPQATKGRKAHPPKAGKVWKEKINKKEWLAALYSAIAASADKDISKSRGHIVHGTKHFPIVVDDGLQELKKSSDVRKVLEELGLEKELARVKPKRARAGKGKMRGRRTIQKKGPVIIIAEDKGIIKAARNLAGVEATTLADLNVETLAPGTHPGRLAIWTKSAVEALEKTTK